MTRSVDQRLVGRDSELDAVDRALDALERGEPSPLLIEGEPGIGKTRLVAELEARASARAYLVLRGSASELESDLPFWIFVDALDEYVAGLDPRKLSGLSDETLGEIAHMLPSAVDAGEARLVHDERYRAHRAVRELLERLATPRPLVLVLDDVHWADPASVDLRDRAGAVSAGRVRPAGARRPAASTLRAPAHRARSHRPQRRPAADRARGAVPGGGRRAGRRERARAALRRDGRQPVLPRAAGPRPAAPPRLGPPTPRACPARSWLRSRRSSPGWPRRRSGCSEAPR